MAARYSIIACIISVLVVFATGTKVIEISNGYVRCGTAGASTPTGEVANTAISNGVINFSTLPGVIREACGAGNIESPVILNDLPLQPGSYREEYTRIMFEEFNVPKLYITVSAVSSVLAAGQGYTGTIIEITEGVTYVVPVYNGYAYDHRVERREEPITVPALASAVREAILNAEWNEWDELYANIVISGENAPDGIANALQENLQNSVGSSRTVNVIQPAGCKYLSFKGAGMMVGFLTDEFYMSRAEYDSKGKSEANRKFAAQSEGFQMIMDEGEHDEIIAITSDQLFIFVMLIGVFIICQMVFFVYKMKKCWDGKMENVNYEQVRIVSESDC